VIFSLLYLLLRLVLRVPSNGHREYELELESIVLRHQVKVLQRKVGRPKLRRLDKLFLTALSRLLPRQRWTFYSVTPGTLLRWHRELVKRKWTHKTRPVGRPPLDPQLTALIARMAGDNPRWGYMRSKGECQKLGLRVSATTVKKVLLGAGLDAAPRRDGPLGLSYRDAKFSGACDEVFQTEGIRVIRTPIRSPKANAFAEHFVRTVRSEVLDLIFITGRRHLDQMLCRYAGHYDARRPHRGLDLRTRAGVVDCQFATAMPRVRRVDGLGGLICAYEPVAA
jgi:hypothetical protein